MPIDPSAPFLPFSRDSSQSGSLRASPFRPNPFSSPPNASLLLASPLHGRSDLFVGHSTPLRDRSPPLSSQAILTSPLSYSRFNSPMSFSFTSFQNRSPDISIPRQTVENLNIGISTLVEATAMDLPILPAIPVFPGPVNEEKEMEKPLEQTKPLVYFVC